MINESEWKKETWTQFRNVPSSKKNSFEKTKEIRHNGSLILFTCIKCSYLLMYGRAKMTMSNDFHSIKHLALVLHKVPDNGKSCLVWCHLKRFKWMQVGKQYKQFPLNGWKTWEAEILFEHFSLWMDLR